MSWLVIVTSDVVSGGVAVVALVVGLGLFGVAETLWAPVAPAIVNDLASEDMRGRYNALQGMTWTVGSIVGPAMAGMLIGHGLPHLWVACVVGGTAARGAAVPGPASTPDRRPGRSRIRRSSVCVTDCAHAQPHHRGP